MNITRQNEGLFETKISENIPVKRQDFQEINGVSDKLILFFVGGQNVA